MENKEQTAVEWLVEQLEKHHVHHDLKNTVVFEQAKEMEKQQIMDAWENGNHKEIRGGKYLKPLSSKYYKEKYGKDIEPI